MRRLLVPIVLAAVLLTACGDDARTGNAGTAGATTPASEVPAATEPLGTSTPTDTATPEQVATAPEALQFSAPVVGGGELDMRSYAGQTVAFWFWAPT